MAQLPAKTKMIYLTKIGANIVHVHARCACEGGRSACEGGRSVIFLKIILFEDKKQKEFVSKENILYDWFDLFKGLS